MARELAAIVVWLVAGCTPAQPAATPPRGAPAACGGAPLVVRFLPAGQALAALLELPAGERVLVDAGESPTRAGCGAACRVWHDRVSRGLERTLGSRPLDLLWLTHPHSDHIGGAPAVLEAFRVGVLVDNGRDAERPMVERTRAAAAAKGVRVQVVAPGALDVPLRPAPPVRLTAVVPRVWPASCKDDPNDCSIGLRVDYCSSSLLFVGDAELAEEELLDTGGPVTLLQVGHHGSDTSSGDTFLGRVSPRYAVIPVAEPGEGTNRTFCHPRSVTVERLSRVLGGARTRPLPAFDGAVSCRDPSAADHWVTVQASERLYSTAKGEVVLTTTGDGVFR